MKNLGWLLLFTPFAAFADCTAPCVKMSVASPQEYQVFQRDAANMAALSIQYTGTGKSAFLRTTVRDSHGQTIASGLEPVAAGADAKSASINVPAGGWYTLQLQEIDADKASVLAEGAVAHVGVGEVFLTTGQSNSVPSGQKAQPNDDLVSAAVLNDQQTALTWRHTIDDSDRGTPWPNLANPLAARLKMPVAIIETGCSGSEAAQWLPADANDAKIGPGCGADDQQLGGLFNRLVHATQLLGTYRVILWHQGESDTAFGTSTQAYFTRMSVIISSLNKATGGMVRPWMIAKVSYFPSKEVDANCAFTVKPATLANKMMSVRAAQQILWDRNVALAGPDTDALIGSEFRYSGPIGLCIHFSDKGLQVHGQSWYRALVESAIIPGTDWQSNLTTQVLNQFHAPKTGDIRYASGKTIAGYSFDAQAFAVETTPSAENALLRECTFNNGAHFVSNSPTCENFPVVDTLGYVSENPATPAVRPLHRVFDPKRGVFASTTSMDAVLTSGYAYLALTGYAPVSCAEIKGPCPNSRMATAQ